jgi:hypothetical protein
VGRERDACDSTYHLWPTPFRPLFPRLPHFSRTFFKHHLCRCVTARLFLHRNLAHSCTPPPPVSPPPALSLALLVPCSDYRPAVGQGSSQFLPLGLSQAGGAWLALGQSTCAWARLTLWRFTTGGGARPAPRSNDLWLGEARHEACHVVVGPGSRLAYRLAVRQRFLLGLSRGCVTWLTLAQSTCGGAAVRRRG